MFGLEAGLIALAIEEAKMRRKSQELWDARYLGASSDVRRLMEIEREERAASDRNRQLCDAIRSKKLSIF